MGREDAHPGFPEMGERLGERAVLVDGEPLAVAARGGTRDLQPAAGPDGVRREDPHAVAAPQDGGEVARHLDVFQQDGEIRLAAVEHGPQAVVSSGQAHRVGSLIAVSTRYDTRALLQGAPNIQTSVSTPKNGEGQSSMAIVERTGSGIDQITQLLGADADDLLSFTCKGIPKEQITAPGPDHVERVWSLSDRKPPVLVNLQRLYGTGRLANTGYLSILPVDQGIEHSAARVVRPQPDLLRPREYRQARDRGAAATPSPRRSACSAAVARKYAHKIPFIAKINHNELLTYPNKAEQILFGSVEQAWDMGAAAIGATIYFGSDDADREIIEISEAFEQAHELGMATVLWCYTPQQRLQEGRRRLPHLRRPHRPGQPPRRDDRRPTSSSRSGRR